MCARGVLVPGERAGRKRNLMLLETKLHIIHAMACIMWSLFFVCRFVIFWWHITILYIFLACLFEFIIFLRIV